MTRVTLGVRRSMAKYNAKKAQKLKKEYDALKQKKTRAKSALEKKQIQAQINDVVADLEDMGSNTRGTPRQPQGGTQPRCFCSAADLATYGHRPNCPAGRAGR
jgi:membrane protein involved in colicin uptake